MSKNKAIIFCAPSGSGKTTLVKHLLTQVDDLGFSISACTRDKRGRNEKNGQDYYFLSIEDFKNKINNKEFIEWEEVYSGGFYGTLKSEIDRLWKLGKNVIFDVDVQGGLRLKEYFGDQALAIYVNVESMEELESRLRNRGTETEESLSKRLYKVQFERSFKDQFDVILNNENLIDSQEKSMEMYQKFTNNKLNIDHKPLVV